MSPGSETASSGGASGPPRARVRTVADQVASSLREMILLGDLTPGSHVTHDRLATELGVSTMPVREAMLRLSHEGLLESSRGRSYRVPRTRKQDILDIYWLQATLAGELTARACTQLDDASLRNLRRLHTAWTDALGTGSPAELERINFELHRIINTAADAPKLLTAMKATLRLIPTRFYAQHPEWADSATRSHEAIIEALAERDAGAARQQAEEHVRSAGDLLIQYFDEKGFWNVPAT